MEALNVSALGDTKFFCKISSFRANSYSANLFRKNTERNSGYHRNLVHKNPLLSSSLVFNVRKSDLPNRLGAIASIRRSKRRNSLRKKLIDEQLVRNPNFAQQEFPLQNSDLIVEQESPSGSIYSDNISFKDSSDVVELETDKLDSNFFKNNSVLWNELENWASQYKEDIDYWGIGSSPVFTVYQDSNGNVDWVSVNEDEIVRRSGIEPWFLNQEEQGEDPSSVKSKISRAKALAREVEAGRYKFLKNSSIAKFVIQGKTPINGNLSEAVGIKIFSISKFSQIGFVVLCGSFIFWAIKNFFAYSVKLTRVEKEMLRRKIKSRTEKEKIEKGNVEVLENVSNSMIPTVRPQLNRDELMQTILKAKVSREPLSDPPGDLSDAETDFDDKIVEIQEMARQVRKLEQHEPNTFDMDGETIDATLAYHGSKSERSNLESNANNNFDFELEELDRNTISEIKSPVNDMVNEEVFMEKKEIDTLEEKDMHFQNHLAVESENSLGINEAVENRRRGNITEDFSIESSKNAQKNILKLNGQESNIEHGGNLVFGKCEGETKKSLSNTSKEENFQENSVDSLPSERENSLKMKPRIITSVKEAREFLSQKCRVVTDKGSHDRKEQAECVGRPNQGDGSINRKLHFSASKFNGLPSQQLNDWSSQKIFEKKEILESSELSPTLDTALFENKSKDFTKEGQSFDGLKLNPCTSLNASLKNGKSVGTSSASLYSIDAVNGAEAEPVKAKENWVEMNFEKFEPIIEKMGVGFKENYMVAKEKVQDQSSLITEISDPRSKEDDEEFEWMKDDDLREIVFQVRKNELEGRDPFHLMDGEDQDKFFKGLEKRVEKENVKLMKLHEWVHSRVENLDYGADGISLYDSPDKIIPRWKGPPIDRDPEFLENYIENRRKIISEKLGMLQTSSPGIQNGLRESEEPSFPNGVSTSSAANLSKRQRPQDRASTNPKTVIQSSDGSTKAGKKSGKEYWQHTKKWSREFLEVYNAETDPEVKSVMKDMGRDLDRWITDKEIQEAADLMSRIPKKKRQSIEKKLGKLKRECEMFGPQAVVSKYREYTEEKEEDYLWWLDRRFILCIELYTVEDNNQRVGFYSLEMAEELELDPKQYHVIAFEDPGDAKNFCYIIQAHAEMIGNGMAFVVARLPKDAFRDAQANGFSVTVIKKGQLQLNVDQMLEEVESEIIEIGSKMYHDKIMRERSVDMGALMNGVFGRRKSTRRRSKRMLTKSTKS